MKGDADKKSVSPFFVLHKFLLLACETKKIISEKSISFATSIRQRALSALDVKKD